MSETDQATGAAAAKQAGEPEPRSAARARTRRSTLVLAGVAILAGLAFATVFAFGITRLSVRPGSGPLRPAGIPGSVSTKLADMMQLSPVPASAAPAFTLTDQAGRPVSLASFRGKTVVLTFMDSHCTDICPLVSREFIDAYQELGSVAKKVAFVAVNVNPTYRRVADVASFSSEQQLNSIGSWYFLTGSLASLRKVWSDYQIQVEVPSKNADVIHTSLIYFIDSQGRERYVTLPMVDHTAKGAAYLPPGQLRSWAHGIALVARATIR